MLDISSQIFYTKATNLMSGSGKALINIIYECCLIQLQRPRNQNKQIFEGFAGTKRQRLRKVREVSKCGCPLPRATIGGAIRLLLSPSSSVQAGFLSRKAGKARAAGEGGQEKIWPEVLWRPGAPYGDLRPCSAGHRGPPRLGTGASSS